MYLGVLASTDFSGVASVGVSSVWSVCSAGFWRGRLVEHCLSTILISITMAVGLLILESGRHILV